MGFSNGLNGLPDLWKAIALVGFPVILCVFFLLKDVGIIPNRYDRILDEAYKAHNLLIITVKQNSTQILDLKRLTHQIHRINMASCLNNASDKIEINRCLQAQIHQGIPSSPSLEE